MGLVQRADVATLADPAWRLAWVEFAVWHCTVDQATAQRLVFVRWLVATGRLTEW
jgi:hypothetical protein